MDGLSIRNSVGNLNSGRVGNDSQFPKIQTTEKSSGNSFADTLQEAVGKVNTLQHEADDKMQKLATGETTDIADVKIAVEKADIALRLMTSVRNKMIDAYHEIMKMQV